MLSIKRETPASEILVFLKFTFHARWLTGLSRQTAATWLDRLALFIWTEDVCRANTGLYYMLFSLKWITFLAFHPLPACSTNSNSLSKTHVITSKVFSLQSIITRVKKCPASTFTSLCTPLYYTPFYIVKPLSVFSSGLYAP